MNIKNRQHLIDELTLDLKPVKSTNVALMSLIYLMGFYLFILSVYAVTGPFRSGSANQLISSMQFLAESAAGFLSIAILLYSGFKLAIPAPKTLIDRLKWPLLSVLIWLGFYMVDLVSPALQPSTDGMRAHCSLQVFIFALPTLFIGFYWVNKQWPVYPVSTGLLVGLASGCTSTLIMQFACMYEPQHTLIAHVLPGILVGVLGAVVGLVTLINKK